MARRAQPFNVIIQGRRLEVGDTLKRYAERKLRKLSRHLDQLREAQVVLEVERQRSAGRTQVAEVTVWGDGLVLRGTHRSGDMFASIDGVVEKLEKQIEKRRSRLIEKRRIDATRSKRRQVAGAEAADDLLRVLLQRLTVPALLHPGPHPCPRDRGRLSPVRSARNPHSFAGRSRASSPSAHRGRRRRRAPGAPSR